MMSAKMAPPHIFAELVAEIKGDNVIIVHPACFSSSDKDKKNFSQVMKTRGVQNKNKFDFLSLSYTRHAEDVSQAREFLSGSRVLIYLGRSKSNSYSGED